MNRYILVIREGEYEVLDAGEDCVYGYATMQLALAAKEIASKSRLYKDKGEHKFTGFNKDSQKRKDRNDRILRGVKK